MIAIIAAVPFETEILRRELAPCEVRSCGRRDLFQGHLCGCPVALLHSGVGKANAAGAMTSLIHDLRPSLVINLGVGGAYPGKALEVGGLALATEEVYGDEGVSGPSGFLDMRALGLPLVQCNGSKFYNTFPVHQETLVTVREILEGKGHKAVCGPFVTVSNCSGTDAAAMEMSRRTGGVCENMEGAAVAQVCALHTIPFLELRGISNHTEDRDLSRWDLRRAAEKSQMALRDILCGWPDGRIRA